MAFCPNCGATIEPTQNFCANCGYPLSAKARKMVMGVAQQMLLMAPQSDESSAPKTDANGILDSSYQPNTRSRQNSNRIDPENDPYLQTNSVQQPFSGTSTNQNSETSTANAAFGTTAPNSSNPTNQTQSGNQQANDYVDRSTYDQLSAHAVSYNAPAGEQAQDTRAAQTYTTDTNTTPSRSEYQNNTQTSNNYADDNYTYGTAGYANDPNLNSEMAASTGAGAYDSYDYGTNYEVNQPATSTYTDGYHAGPDNYGANSGAPGQSQFYNANAAGYGQTTAYSDTGYNNYNTNGYVAQPGNYGDTAAAAPQDNGDYNDDSEEDQDEDNLTFFQKIGVTDYITTALSIILIVTNFVGAFVTDTPFGNKGQTLWGQMQLGGASAKTTVMLLLILLMVGPVAMIVFSIWKPHAAHIIKLVAAVVSILAYIATFGILITMGIIAASGLQNFNFGIAAIVAIVALIANFIVAVIDFVRY